ncbi:hypothetical protein DFH28DRAFT_1188045 [Melampsora americana]|nr:hypothetical protein DFH28DRAFT_1188045 [Melampsora americana]
MKLIECFVTLFCELILSFEEELRWPSPIEQTLDLTTLSNSARIFKAFKIICQLQTNRIKRNHRSNSISSNTSTNSSNSTLPTTINRSNRRMSPFTDKAGLPSPCFVHSHLDSNLSLPNHQSRSPHRKDSRFSKPVSSSSNAESLTRQLAQTATSNQRKCPIDLDKAWDNHLIKLTRELAIWLMDSKPFTSLSAPNPEDTQLERKPLVVYVDSQLKRSKRFDLNSIKTEYPQFFNPLRSRHPFRRRFSRANSVSSNSTTSSSEDVNLTAEEDGGQLRYWTAEMCNKSPELFDFVITLGGDGTVLFNRLCVLVLRIIRILAYLHSSSNP